MRVLAIDLGTKRVGLAISDTGGRLATPHAVLEVASARHAIDPILKLIRDEDVQRVVIGLPLNMDGSIGPAAQSARAFARNLIAMRDAPLLMWDERLSTAAVTRTLIEGDASRKRRGEVVDKVAASYMLQGALDAMQERRANG